MKKLIFFTLFFISLITKSMSQDITGFLNIPFSTPYDSCVSILRERGFEKNEISDQDRLIFTKQQFAGYDTEHIVMFFYNSMFFGSELAIKPKYDAQILENYHQIVKDLSIKYGKPKTVEVYQYPYEKNDGHYETAIKLGKATIGSFWENKTTGNFITIGIDPEMYIKINYVDKAKATQQNQDNQIRKQKDL